MRNLRPCLNLNRCRHSSTGVGEPRVASGTEPDRFARTEPGQSDETVRAKQSDHRSDFDSLGREKGLLSISAA